MTLSQADRDAERAKYVRAYAKHNYRMGPSRLEDSRALLASLPCRGSYLDVGCGRRDMLKAAPTLGFLPVHGTEIVPALIDGATVVEAWADALPFSAGAFDVVSAFDVLEHLHQESIPLAVSELARVARRHVLISVNNNSSQAVTGEELHVTRWPYDVWDEAFRRAFKGQTVSRDQTDRVYGGQFWRVDLCESR
jgi:SAM-dependent methyltransferase